MCQFASFVLTKDRAFWLPDSDSHSEIISHFEIHESGVYGLNVVKVEIVPGPNITRFDDYDNWVLSFDQDQFPEWHDPITSEKRARAALLQRAKDGFITVDAGGYTKLTSLNAPKATTVYARGCTNLISLSAPKATNVDAYGCTNLISLSAPNATYVDARGCTKLKLKSTV